MRKDLLGDTGKHVGNTWSYIPTLNANDESLPLTDTTDFPIKTAIISSPRYPQHEGTAPKFKYRGSEHRLYECDTEIITSTNFNHQSCKKDFQRCSR